HGRLDRIGVGDGGDDLAGMTRHQSGERGGHARLHLRKRLTAWKAKAARVALDDAPLGLFARPLERESGPVADVELGEIALDTDGQVALPRDGQGCFPGTLERRGIDGGELWNFRDAVRCRVGLTTTFVAQMKPGCAARQLD